MVRRLALIGGLCGAALVIVFLVSGGEGDPSPRGDHGLAATTDAADDRGNDETHGTDDPPDLHSDQTGRGAAEAKKALSERVYDLIYGDPYVRLRRILDDFNRRVRSSAESGPHLTNEDGRFHPLLGLVERPENYSVLMADSEEIRGRFWGLVDLVETLINTNSISEPDKLSIGNAFLREMGVASESDRVATLPDLYEAILQSRDGLIEARELARLLGQSFSEDQARAAMHALRGFGIKQERLNRLRHIQREGLTEADAELVAKEIERLAIEKRIALGRILTPEQITLLYVQYDSDAYWAQRLGAR